MTASDAPTGGGSIIRHVRSHPYHLYVLVIITIVYLLNQLDRYTYVHASNRAPSDVLGCCTALQWCPPLAWGRAGWSLACA